MTDYIQRFLFKDLNIRGEIVKISDSVQTSFFNKTYPPEIKTIMAELIPAACLLSASLKFNGSLIIQAQNVDPLVALMAECTNDFKFRSIARWDKEHWTPSSDNITPAAAFQTLFTNGHLTITISPKKGNRYQGIVPLEKPELAGCISDYFLQSEQLPTKVFFAHSSETLVGLMIQRLPEQSGTDDKPHHAPPQSKT